MDPAETLSPKFKDLINKMMSYDVEERPSILDIRNHPWLVNESEKLEVSYQSDSQPYMI